MTMSLCELSNSPAKNLSVDLFRRLVSRFASARLLTRSAELELNHSLSSPVLSARSAKQAADKGAGRRR